MRRIPLEEIQKDTKKIANVLYDLAPKIPKLPETCKFILPDDKEVELPILKGTSGPPMIDISNLYAKTDYFTFVSGFTCTRSCASQITFIDGEKGQIMYRGYNISDLRNNCDFPEICYLLFYGNYPLSQIKRNSMRF